MDKLSARYVTLFQYWVIKEIRVPISDVVYGREEVHNVYASILEITEDEFYCLGNKTGID